MEKIVKIGYLSIVFLIPLAIFVSMLINPMRRPHRNVRNYILRQTPLGTSMDDVISFAGRRAGWRIPRVNREHGFLHRGEPIPGWPVSALSGHSVIGEMSVRVYAERYHAWYKLFVPTGVTVFWGFDTEGNLIEVFVWKAHEMF